MYKIIIIFFFWCVRFISGSLNSPEITVVLLSFNDVDELTTVSSSPFRSCLACSLLSCITLRKNKQMLSLSTTKTDLLAAHVNALNLRELVQLAALLLVGGSELLVLHSEPLLLQHDLLVQTGGNRTQTEINDPGQNI